MIPPMLATPPAGAGAPGPGNFGETLAAQAPGPSPAAQTDISALPRGAGDDLGRIVLDTLDKVGGRINQFERMGADTLRRGSAAPASAALPPGPAVQPLTPGQPAALQAPTDNDAAFRTMLGELQTLYGTSTLIKFCESVASTSKRTLQTLLTQSG